MHTRRRPESDVIVYLGSRVGPCDGLLEGDSVGWSDGAVVGGADGLRDGSCPTNNHTFISRLRVSRFTRGVGPGRGLALDSWWG
jgi:hypothetical protein